MRKKVSVVIPCFNQGHYLQQSVRSALASYSGPLEIIIVDDGSTDPKTYQYLEDVARLDFGIRVITQKNCGLSGARNTGIENSTGDFLQFLDADDVIIPKKIDVQVAHLESTDSIYVSVCDFLFAESDFLSFSKHDNLIASHNLELLDFLYKWERGFSIPIHCGLFCRSIFDNVKFNTVVRAKEDWVFWSSLLARGMKMAYIPLTGAVYRVHSQSMCRSSAHLGKEWLKAAFQIEQLVGEAEPGFIRASVDWFNEHYSNQGGDVENSGLMKQAEQTPERVESNSYVTSTIEVAKKRKTRSYKGGGAPLLSVIVPVFNHFQYLGRCLSSILEQGDVEIELICVNDASTDHRVQSVLEEYSRYFEQATVIKHERNLGISASQNEAIQIAKGDYIAFLDCDDCLAPGALETIKQKLLNEHQADYIFTDRLDVDEHDKELRYAVYGGYDWLKPSGNIKSDLLDGMVASHLKVIRKQVLLEVGGFDSAVAGVQDWDLALKVADQGGGFLYVPEALYRHRIHGNSVTNSDVVGQFRRTNIVRRRYQERWYKRHVKVLSPEELSRDLLAGRLDAQSQGVLVFKHGEREQCLRDLKQAWLQDNLCVMDARGGIEVPCIYFLREFNSYFDCIVWDTPQTYTSLVGYCWDDNLLCRIGADL